jgi:hypothetical protein
MLALRNAREAVPTGIVVAGGGTERAAMKTEYQQPQVVDFGSVTELTQTGLTRPGDDLKDGSVASGGQ